MIEVHITEVGKKMFVSQMTDEHLLATVKLNCERIKSLLDKVAGNLKVNEVQSAIYGIDAKRVSEKAHKLVPLRIRSLYPYVTEAALRGLEVSPILQDAFGRKEPELEHLNLMSLDPMSGRIEEGDAVELSAFRKDHRQQRVIDIGKGTVEYIDDDDRINRNFRE